jgi:hypothetical protein
MIHLVSMLVLAAFAPPVLARDSACVDISSVDFKNYLFVARRETRPVSYGAFNGPAPGGPIRLRNGRFYEWDETPEVSPGNSKPDWLTEIGRDLIVHPRQSAGIRVLSLTRTHLTGTGSFTYIFAFACRNGAVTKIFEASGEGVKLTDVTDAAMDIDVAVWAKGDAHASPSRIVPLHYVWSPESKRFLRSSSNAACPWMP